MCPDTPQPARKFMYLSFEVGVNLLPMGVCCLMPSVKRLQPVPMMLGWGWVRKVAGC